MKSRRKNIKYYGRIRKLFILGGALLLLAFVVFGGFYDCNRLAAGVEALTELAEIPEMPDASGTSAAEPLYDALETEEILNQEYGHKFLNEEPAKYPDDNRTVFRIYEVIPHDVCSVFPYMVEWGSPEEYDKNVPIGYEGLMAMSNANKAIMFFEDGTAATTDYSMYYTQIPKAFYEQTLGKLENYGINLSVQNDDTYGTWYVTTGPLESDYRKRDPDLSKSTAVDGYFEYVGNRKGLFYIATSYVKGQDNAASGINYRLQAISRKGNDNAKGELHVASPAYYLAYVHEKPVGSLTQFQKDSGTLPIKSKTGYNYDLAFAHGTGVYRADLGKVSSNRSGAHNDYNLAVDPDTWTSFEFVAGGGYQISKVTPNSGKGAYVRSASNTLTDSYAGYPSGFFKLADQKNTGDFDIDFVKAAAGNSFYSAFSSDLKNETAASYHFEYVGSGKGAYDVSFIYGAEPANNNQYYASLLEVSDNGGQYALTSTEESESDSGQPLYDAGSSTLPKDYAKVITYIDYTDKASNGTDNKVNGIGVVRGGTDKYDEEYGGWVFHPIGNEEQKLTFLSEVEAYHPGGNSNLDFEQKPGTRIYVKDQEIRYRYYCRNGFKNNEWLKLLGLVDHPNSTDTNKYSYGVRDSSGVGYNWSASPAQNLRNPVAQGLIQAFDQNYRIEIIQKTIDELTPDNVKDASLIYISRCVGIQGLDSGVWADINRFRVANNQEEMEPYPTGVANWVVPHNGDLRDDTLKEIYDRCVVERKVALMMEQKWFISGSGLVSMNPSRNYEKLVFLLNGYEEARDFQYFLPDWYSSKAIPQFTKIYNNLTASACVDGGGRSRYNMEYVDSRAEKDRGTWERKYFVVHTDDLIKLGLTLSKLDSDLGDTNSYRVGETKLMLGEYGPGEIRRALFNMQGGKTNLWDLLDNSMVDPERIFVWPINTGKIREPDGSGKITGWVIYGNEYDPSSFDIVFNVRKEMGQIVSGAVVTCKLDDGTLLYAIAEPDPDNLGYMQYRVNARSGFESGGKLNPAVLSRTVTITAASGGAVSPPVDVKVIMREAFFLN